MKRILSALIILLSMYFYYHSNSRADCYECVSGKPSRIDTVSSFQIYEGHSFQLNERFEYKCLYLNSEEVNKRFIEFERLPSENSKLKIVGKDEYKLYNNDTLKACFYDDEPLLWNSSKQKLIYFIVKQENTVCDSVNKIVYQSISNEINKLTERETKLSDLFTETLRNNIQNYLKSLPTADRVVDNKCLKDYYILDWLENSNKFGFEQNKYQLTNNLKAYLNIISDGISRRLNQNNWNKTKFIIKVVGYADERNYTGNGKIILFPKNSILTTDCYNITDYKNLTSELGIKLKKITDNCSLSMVRGYVAANYLKQRLNYLCKHEVEIQYKGGGESSGTNYDNQRKINIFIELKGVTEKL